MQKTQLLIIKSENLTAEQLSLLEQKSISITHLSLLQFEYNHIQFEENNYDYILFNSVNGVEAYLRSNQNHKVKMFMVVGNKTKEKLQQSIPTDVIQAFNNQQELIAHLLSFEESLHLLYIVGNLSEISVELQQKHTVTIIEGYKTLPYSKGIDLNFKCFDYIVYYSNSNYNQFKLINKELKEDVLHIFFGLKCSAGNTEKNYKILEKPTFEALCELF